MAIRSLGFALEVGRGSLRQQQSVHVWPAFGIQYIACRPVKHRTDPLARWSMHSLYFNVLDGHTVRNIARMTLRRKNLSSSHIKYRGMDSNDLAYHLIYCWQTIINSSKVV